MLYLVATPIGDTGDITLRAIEILKTADAVVCEEFRQGSTLLKKLGIGEKQLLLLNEHSEIGDTEEIISLLLSGKNIALISDCGTPGFADPGTYLIKRCAETGIPFKGIPGPSSLMLAVSLSPLPLDEFYFAGFLPRKENERKQKLKILKDLDIPVILMDTPYRLSKLLHEIKDSFGGKKTVTLALDLTMKEEEIFHGSLDRVMRIVRNRKGEFILILH